MNVHGYLHMLVYMFIYVVTEVMINDPFVLLPKRYAFGRRTFLAICFIHQLATKEYSGMFL